MKTTPTICLLVSLLFVAHTTTYEMKCNSDESPEDHFCTPISMTRSGIDTFISSIYNHPSYAQTLLPYNFCHLLQLLHHGVATKQPRSYIQSILRLFTNKLKACPYVDADSCNALLGQLPALLEPYTIPTRQCTIDVLQKRIDSVVYAQFLKKFDTFKTDPDCFLKDLSCSIYHEVESVNNDQDFISLEELQKNILVFLEIMFCKLVWNPTTKQESWHLVKSIAESTTVFLERGLLTHTDDLNGLFVSLIERYCFFIDLFALELSPDFYDGVMRDVLDSAIPLLELEEQEELIEPKKGRLLHTLFLAKARYSYEHAHPRAIDSIVIPQEQS